MDALGIILFLAFILGTIFVIMNQAKKARQTYGFGLIMNWTFLLIVFSFATLFFWGLESTAAGSDHESNALVLKITCVALVGLACFINVKRSSVGFGIWFTFLQIVAAVGVIVPLFLLFSHFRTKGVMSDMMR